MRDIERRPLLIVISAPSGAGKSTLCRRLLAEFPGMVYSVSCTTRSPRGNETHGKDYYFMTEAEFKSRRDRDEFLEHAVVHGHLYGTLAKTVENALSEGKDVLMAIDAQGARQIRRRAQSAPKGSLLGRAFVDVFVSAPSKQALRERLIARNEDSADDVERRLLNAEKEMACAVEYKHHIVNDNLDAAYAELRSIVESERRCGGATA